MNNISIGQTSFGAIEQPELNVFYRGYNNRVIPSITNNDGGKVILSGTNCAIVMVENSHEFIVKPGRGKAVVLTISLKKEDTIIPIRSIEYRVQNLPNPVLYWGASKSGSKANLHSNILLAKYPPSIPLKAHFSVVGWTITIGEETLSETGANISKAQSLLKKLNAPNTVSFTAKVKGPDGIVRQISGNWSVNKWSEPKPTKNAVGCG